MNNPSKATLLTNKLKKIARNSKNPDDEARSRGHKQTITMQPIKKISMTDTSSKIPLVLLCLSNIYTFLFFGWILQAW